SSEVGYTRLRLRERESGTVSAALSHGTHAITTRTNLLTRSLPAPKQSSVHSGHSSPTEERVLVDHRNYRIKPGKVAAHLDLYEKHGFTAQTPHLAQPVAYMFSESGEINTLVHSRAYEDAA